MSLKWLEVMIVSIVVIIAGVILWSKPTKSAPIIQSAVAVEKPKETLLDGYTYSITESDPNINKMMNQMGAKHIGEGEAPDIRVFEHITPGHKQIYVIFQCHGQKEKALQQANSVLSGYDCKMNPYYMDEVRRALIRIATKRLRQVDADITDRIKQ